MGEIELVIVEKKHLFRQALSFFINSPVCTFWCCKFLQKGPNLGVCSSFILYYQEKNCKWSQIEKDRLNKSFPMSSNDRVECDLRDSQNSKFKERIPIKFFSQEVRKVAKSNKSKKNIPYFRWRSASRYKFRRKCRQTQVFEAARKTIDCCF